MNVKEFNPQGRPHIVYYLIGTIILTGGTIWLMVALLSGHLSGASLLERIFWPYVLGKRFFLDPRRPWNAVRNR
jgi:hypothetical protein